MVISASSAHIRMAVKPMAVAFCRVMPASTLRAQRYGGIWPAARVGMKKPGRKAGLCTVMSSA
jgi:hypothetical protein